MPDTIQEWHAQDVIFEVFLEHLGAFPESESHKKSLRNTRHSDWFTHARSRRVPSMVHMGVHKKWYSQFPLGRLLDRAHARKMRFEGCDPEITENHQNAEKHAGYHPGMACRGCHFEAFWSILKHFRGQKAAKIASKHAPQRRVYARSVQTGPIDGTH
eukprot:gene25405-biopygen20982